MLKTNKCFSVQASHHLFDAVCKLRWFHSPKFRCGLETGCSNRLLKFALASQLDTVDACFFSSRIILARLCLNEVVFVTEAS